VEIVGTIHRLLESQYGSTAVSMDNFKTPYDYQCQLKHVVQCAEAFEQVLKDTFCVCKKLLNKF
jgi:hypothetical protein